jgi:hypothetical protein
LSDFSLSTTKLSTPVAEIWRPPTQFDDITLAANTGFPVGHHGFALRELPEAFRQPSRTQVFTDDLSVL